MLYLSTIGAMLLAACVCTFTFIVVDKRTKLSKELSPELKKAEDSEAIVSDSETNSESGASAQESLQKKLRLKQF